MTGQEEEEEVVHGDNVVHVCLRGPTLRMCHSPAPAPAWLRNSPPLAVKCSESCAGCPGPCYINSLIVRPLQKAKSPIKEALKIIGEMILKSPPEKKIGLQVVTFITSPLLSA